jgi:CobQ-like glutamine amidotransferase family enzyme
MNKYKRHTDICEALSATYKIKNEAYNDSFGKTFQELGIISAVTRMQDKWNRIKALATGTQNNVTDERLEDTLLDMANYCIMTLIELEAKTDGSVE